MFIKKIVVGAALALALSAGTSVAQEFEVKVSYNQPETSPAWQEVFQAYADELEELSNGRIEAETYPGGVLHPVGDGFKALVSGVTDATAAYPIYMASSFNLIHANELPHALPDSDIAATRVVNEMYPDYYMDEYERVGVYLGFYAVTPSYDILSRKPISSVDDLKGMKIRAAGGTMSEIVERLGAVPVTMTITDTYSAFQQGVLDAVLLSTADLGAYNLDEIGKYNYRIGIGRVAIPTGFNKALYDSMPEDLQEVVAVAGRHAAMNYAKMYTKLTEDALAGMNEEGVEIIEPSEADLARIDELLAPIYAAFIEKNASMQDPTAEETLAQLEQLTEKYGAMNDEDILALDEEQPVTGAFH